MRKVTEQTVSAFMAKESCKVGNTETDGQSLFLHGNRIAWHVPDGIMISSCGWETATTKERLNGVLSWRNKGICQKKGQWYIMDYIPANGWEMTNFVEWDGKPILIKR